MADGRRHAGEPEAATVRVAHLDEITGGAEAASTPVARLGEVFAPGAAPDSDRPGAASDREDAAGRAGSVDLAGIDTTGPRPAPPVAALAAPAGGDEPGPVALFDTEELEAGRADVSVAELAPGALRRAGRGAAGGRHRDRSGGQRTEGGPEGRARGERRGEQGAVGGPETEDAQDERPKGRLRAGRRRAGRAGSGAGREELDAATDPDTDADADPVAVAREICLGLLTDRARTRRELAQALRRKGVPDHAANSVLERFDEVGLIDDAAFAGQWVRSRHAHRGLARRAIAMELRRKGVSDEDAAEALAEVDAESEERRARELVDRKLRSLAVDTAERRTVAGRRLVGMLARKGYGAGIAYRVVKEALAERGAEADELADGEIPED
jgi:regulatory protein